MRPALILVLAVLAAAGTSLLMNLSSSESNAATPVLDKGGPSDATVSALEAEVEALRAEVEGLRAAKLAAGAGGTRSEVVDVEAQVLAVLAERGLLEPGAAPVARAAELDEELANLSVEDLVAMLNADDLSDIEWSSIWEKARKAGLTDELVAFFEQQAEQNPNDANAQAEVGYAYLAKIQEVTDGPIKGQLGMQADKAFDRALEIDPNHWRARFMKALSYSFWPAFTGKPAQAITQLEILVERQANLPRDEKHAQSYLMLGNLYQQQGRLEEAQQAWANGAQMFPENAELQQHVQPGDGE